MSGRRRTLRDVVLRRLRLVGAVLLLALCVALVALERSLHHLQDGAGDAAIDTVRLWNEILLGVVVVLVILVIVLGWTMWRAIQRRVTDPLAHLAASVRAASTGAHEHEIRFEGDAVAAGEVADLASDVEHMRRELVAQLAELGESHAEAQRAHALIEEQARELERSNRDLEQFAYVASHDLQEPLRKVASFTQLLQKRYGDRLDDRADQYIAFAVDGARRMQRLIQDLLSFSRVGRSGDPPRDVDLNGVLDQVLHDLEHRIEQSGAQVTHDPLPVVRGEPALLAMLLGNVVGNGLKFAHPDRPPRVHLTARRAAAGPDFAGGWELSCADNGIGIDPQYAERVFVIFQRLHPKEVYSGTGIGLALVKRVVEHHGGSVWLEPTDGGGTTVRWTLSAAGPPSGEAAGTVLG
ncbi:sensor histidine kinase [Isoptericola sp. NEAU-Y5]|uniref:histidine kinase n=1 Tax=Isoptericola luteus TaxID=2879484 RepID=A0ABS7ZFT4_9MICO|nr:ATP-binding protein [Isoptericola sp. NEAU-Y5]MCA5893166.1 sensor histidine kinase [Isoptericola sp. NEAU-Y5]